MRSASMAFELIPPPTSMMGGCNGPHTDLSVDEPSSGCLLEKAGGVVKEDPACLRRLENLSGRGFDA